MFFKTILFLVGPVTLFTCTIHTFYEVNIIGDPDFDWDRIGSYVASRTIYTQLRWIINGLVTAMVVSHFIKVYKEKGPGKFDVNDVTKSLFSDFGGTALTAILVFVMVTLLSIVVATLIYGVAELSVGAGVFLLIVGYLVYFLVRFPFWYFMYSIFFARHADKEKRNPFSGMRLAATVLSGNWWSTWVIFFCMWMLLAVLGTVISLPAEILAMLAQLSTFDPTSNTDVDWKLLESILTSLGEFARTLIYSVFSAAIALHFYSLKEKKDGKGTLEMLDQIGKNKDDDHIELTY
ncbi:MAG TPA: hypothetical protein VK826_16245 [Bacteroidia bacterium]|nr:hypothetical protein [Bacteroidia bacterium]